MADFYRQSGRIFPCRWQDANGICTQIASLTQQHNRTLRNTGRVEFGHGILPELIRAFYSSPFLETETYAQTLMELQDLFYELKNESGDRLSDAELLDAMRRAFDGPAGGAAEYLAGVSLEELCRAARNGETCPADETEKSDEE